MARRSPAPLALVLAAQLAPAALVAQSLDDATRARVDSVFAEYTRPGMPGCACLVRRDGRTVHAQGYGLASIELGVPITPRTVMDIGSTSKQLTAAAIWLLAQDGKLALDDEVQRFVPELPRIGDTRVTIRQLLHHTSGWRDYTFLLGAQGIEDGQAPGRAEALAALARQRTLNFAPGSAWQYSNTGYFLASVIVERVSGMSMRDFLRTRVFTPLGMTQSDVFDDHTRVFPGRAPSYDRGPDGQWHVAASNWEQTGDGAVQTSVEDLAKWDANFDAPVVGGRALVDSLQLTGRLAGGVPIVYAHGLGVDRWRGTRRVQHTGGWAGYRAVSMRLPELRTSVLLTCNAGTANTARLAERVAEAVLGAALGPADSVRLRDAITIARAADYAGVHERWLEPRSGRVVRIGSNGDALAFGAPTATTLAKVGRLPDGALVVLPLADNAPRFRLDMTARTLRSETPNGPETWERVARVRTLDAAALAAIAGSYRSDEVGVAWRIAADSAALVLHPPTGGPLRMVPLFGDAYRTPAGLVRLERDAKDAVVAFTLTNRETVGQRFVREQPVRAERASPRRRGAR